MRFLLDIFRPRHHDEAHDGLAVDAGIRFLATWMDDDGIQTWRTESDAVKRAAVKALLGVRQAHADEIAGRLTDDGR